MKKELIIGALRELFAACPGNILTEETAMAPELVGLPLFEAPLVGFGSAEDSLFTAFQSPGVIGPWYLRPEDWLPGAASVISLFLPFTEQVRASNRGTCVSAQWLQGRVEGQRFLSDYSRRIRDWLTDQGAGACVPALDPRFSAYEGRNPATGEADDAAYGSNWSERHAAYVCGLGTFGLSRGIITEKGMAGRFCSVITTLPLEADPRPYTGLYENCIMCGACVGRCPVGAISLEGGKNHALCSRHLEQSRVRYAPRYGCGLCQTGVPCEHQIPLHR